MALALGRKGLKMTWTHPVYSLLPLREKVARQRRMRGLPNASSASRSTIPLIRPAGTFSLKGRRNEMESK
jgi:hypothetical protein